MRKHLSGTLNITAKNTNIAIDTTVRTRIVDARGMIKRSNSPNQWMIINSIRFSPADTPFFNASVFSNDQSVWMNIFEPSYSSGVLTIEYNISIDYLA